MKSNTFTRTLPVRLTNKEKQILGEVAAKDLEDLAAVRQQLKVTQSTLSNQIKSLESNIHAAGRKIRLGFEDRQVECRYENYDFGPGGKKDIVRADTNETIGNEGVTDEDRERPLLDFTGAGGKVQESTEIK